MNLFLIHYEGLKVSGQLSPLYKKFTPKKWTEWTRERECDKLPYQQRYPKTEQELVDKDVEATVDAASMFGRCIQRWWVTQRLVSGDEQEPEPFCEPGSVPEGDCFCWRYLLLHTRIQHPLASEPIQLYDQLDSTQSSIVSHHSGFSSSLCFVLFCYMFIFFYLFLGYVLVFVRHSLRRQFWQTSIKKIL